MSLGPSGNPTVQGREAKLETDASKRTDMALKEVMGTAAGRRVLWAVINSSGVFGYTADGAAPQRDFGVALIAWFQLVDHEAYLLMQADAAHELKNKQVLDREIERDGKEPDDG